MNKLVRSITTWTKTCDKRLNRLIPHIHHACVHRQCCHVGDAKTMQTAHNSTESEIISSVAELRLEFFFFRHDMTTAPSTSQARGRFPSAPPGTRRSTREHANARAAAQESNDHHRSLQACSTRLHNKGGSDFALNRARERTENNFQCCRRWRRTFCDLGEFGISDIHEKEFSQTQFHCEHQRSHLNKWTCLPSWCQNSGWETIGWENHSWKNLLLIGDERIINLQRTLLKARIDEEPTKFEWNIFPGFQTL